MSEPRFRSTHRLASSLEMFLVVHLVAAVTAAIVTWRELQLLQRHVRGELDSVQPVFEAMSHSRLVARVGLASFAVGACTWLLWQYRSHANLRALGIAELEVRPLRAAIWWFVPVANLWRPFETMRELWKASGADERWWETRTWPLIGWWWAAWLFTAHGVPWILVAFRQIPPSLTPVITADRVVLATNVATVVAGVLAILLVRSIDRRQAGLEAEATTAPRVPPPPPSAVP